MADGFKGIPLTNLWWNEGRNGKRYLRGRLGKATVFIFENQYKREDKHPDMTLFLAPPPEGRDEGRRDNSPHGQGSLADAPPTSGDDEIPF